MNPEGIYALAGALAAYLRALGASQDTISRKTAIDVILGGVSGVLVPVFVLEMKPEWSIFVRGAIVLACGYLTGSLLSMIAAKVPGLGPAILGPVESRKAEAEHAAREAVTEKIERAAAKESGKKP
jgi:hypothetical protein